MPSDFHERYRETPEAKSVSERGFGLTVGGILTAIGGFRWVFGPGLDVATILLLASGSVLLIAGLLFPPLLAVPCRLWMRLGLLLSKVVNPIVLLLIFASTIVPIGLIFRLRGRDLLRTKFDPPASSYWIVRTAPGPAPDTMTRQF